MQPGTKQTVWERLWQRKVPFLIVFYTVFTVTYGLLYLLDFYPEPIEEVLPISETAENVALASDDVQAEANSAQPTEQTEQIEAVAKSVETPTYTAPSAAVIPVSLVIDRLDRTIVVNNPQSRAISDLDHALLSGAVRHPDSADFSEPGNMLILGHSSYLPKVINKNFQAFNGIQTLEWGDTVRVYSNETEYVYRVDRVYEAKASEVVVPNSRGEAKLTLATCNSFGTKDDRYIVEATLIKKVALETPAATGT